jgi:hypothetical protein
MAEKRAVRFGQHSRFGRPLHLPADLEKTAEIRTF